jgi:hypothetical protein
MQMQKGISEKVQQCLKKAFKVVPYNDKQVTLKHFIKRPNQTC